MKRLITASGNRAIDEAVRTFDGYEVVDIIEYRKDVYEAVHFYKPDILLIGEGLAGHESLMEIMLQLVKDFPHLRIVYLAGYVDLRDVTKVNMLGVLVMAGIYDIVHERKITIQYLKNILDHPKTPEQMEYLTNRVKEHSSKEEQWVEFEIPEDKKEDDEDVYQNLYVISSIKPGTGKSFLSTNIAAAIAMYGVETKLGRKPRVALIEADLQNLSVGTLLQIEDDKKNLKSAIDKISTIVNESGKLMGSLKDTEDVNEFIRSCFKPYYRLKNLEALVGSQLTLDQIENIKPYHYVYLLDAIADHYDVIIVDTNSSIMHVTTYPLLHMAKTCYYILNLDFNNVRNNIRYKEVLKEMGIYHKVKYVLNEDITDDEEMSWVGHDIEELMFTADHLKDSDFKLEARIPMLPKTVFLNHLYKGTPVVLDDSKYTLKARYEILKVANQIYPIKNFGQIEKEMMNLKNKKKKGFLFK